MYIDDAMDDLHEAKKVLEPLGEHKNQMSKLKALELFENLSSEDEDDVLTIFSDADDEDLVISLSTTKLDLEKEEVMEKQRVNKEMVSDELENCDFADQMALDPGPSAGQCLAASLYVLPNSAAGDYKNEWCQHLEHFPPELFKATPGLQGPLNLPAWNQSANQSVSTVC